MRLVELAEALLEEYDYDGIYQIASFHPEYLFAGAKRDAPANYTNRAPYPTLHLLRESSLDRAIDSHPDIDGIPQRNIDYSQEKGLEYMKVLRDACF